MESFVIETVSFVIVSVLFVIVTVSFVIVTVSFVIVSVSSGLCCPSRYTFHFDCVLGPGSGLAAVLWLRLFVLVVPLLVPFGFAI